jgi:hypothetical protein
MKYLKRSRRAHTFISTKYLRRSRRAHINYITVSEINDQEGYFQNNYRGNQQNSRGRGGYPLAEEDTGDLETPQMKAEETEITTKQL